MIRFILFHNTYKRIVPQEVYLVGVNIMPRITSQAVKICIGFKRV